MSVDIDSEYSYKNNFHNDSRAMHTSVEITPEQYLELKLKYEAWRIQGRAIH